MSKRIAVIGLGNIYRRDDGIGIEVLKSLLSFHRKSGIDYLDFGVASFDLLHRMSDYGTVLLIDGIDAQGLRPGELAIFELADVDYRLEDTGLSTHEVGLKNIFELYKKFSIKTKVYVAGIQVEDTAHGEGLASPLKDNKEKIIDEVVSFIDKILE